MCGYLISRAEKASTPSSARAWQHKPAKGILSLFKNIHCGTELLACVSLCVLFVGRRSKLQKLAHKIGHRRRSGHKTDQDSRTGHPQLPYLRLLDGECSVCTFPEHVYIITLPPHISLQMMSWKMTVAYCDFNTFIITLYFHHDYLMYKGCAINRILICHMTWPAGMNCDADGFQLVCRRRGHHRAPPHYPPPRPEIHTCSVVELRERVRTAHNTLQQSLFHQEFIGT